MGPDAKDQLRERRSFVVGLGVESSKCPHCNVDCSNEVSMLFWQFLGIHVFSSVFKAFSLLEPVRPSRLSCAGGLVKITFFENL